MIRPVIFSNLQSERFDVLVVSLVDERGHFDVLAFVRNRRTDERTERLFRFEAEDQHARRAVAWTEQLTGLTDAEILRCPDLGLELKHGRAHG